jgi:hypothetical protein
MTQENYLEDYVREIVEAAQRSKITRQQFCEFCRQDINGGYMAEVVEAARPLFGRRQP